jgi:hypothetical protein
MREEINCLSVEKHYQLLQCDNVQHGKPIKLPARSEQQAQPSLILAWFTFDCEDGVRSRYEMSAHLYQTTLHHILEGRIFHSL